MNEPDISPLAKRLAEENNVRWQELKGSGAGGKVVERDVLEYLARVMAGDEAVDPTPEPVPEGMEAWPEEDLSAYRRELGGDLGDLQAELSAADRVESPAVGSGDGDLEIGDITVTSDHDADAFDDAELISEDIFLFEESEPSYEAVDNGVSDDELLIAGDGGVGTGADAGFEFASERSDAGAEQDDFDMFAAPENGDDAGAAVGYDHTAAASDGGEPLPDLFASGDADLYQDDVELFAEADDEIAVRQADAAPEMAAATEEVLVATGIGDEDVADVLTGAVAAEAAYEADREADSSGLEVPDVGLELDAPDEGLTPGAPDEDLDLGAPDETGSSPERAIPVAIADDSGVDADLASDVASEAASDSGDSVSPHDTSEDLPPPVATEVGADLPLVSYGTLLRRHIDLTALAAAQLAVGREVDQGDPIAPTSFVVRAAAKAQRKVSLGEGSIGVASFEDGFGVFSLDDAASVPFAELLQQMAGAVGSGVEVAGMAIVVADMSALEVDEAVLHLGVPVLTLGRILYDNQQGSYRSTLSLAGDVAPDLGAHFLAQVADLLDAPVQLVL